MGRRCALLPVETRRSAIPAFETTPRQNALRKTRQCGTPRSGPPGKCRKPPSVVARSSSALSYNDKHSDKLTKVHLPLPRPALPSRGGNVHENRTEDCRCHFRCIAG